MANQMLVQGGDQEPNLTIEQSLSRYVSNSHLSDVCFIVGDQKIYAHRFLLAIESEVFESMFYGELKETKYEIKVPDLTPVGFRNMMKYFYTKKVEFDLSEMYETYMAANKYMASAFIRDLTDYITANCLEASNVCAMYDQLLRLKIDKLLISEARLLIAKRFSEACANESFEKIGRKTLATILKFDRLNITELDLLKACMRWTDSEVLRQNSVSKAVQKSKRAVFESIKHLIRFGDIDGQPFGSIARIQDYLTVEEIGSILLNQFQPGSPILIDYRSPRKPFNVQVAKGIQIEDITDFSLLCEQKFSSLIIEVNKTVLVSSIVTFELLNFTVSHLEIYKDGKWLTPDCKIVPLEASPSRAEEPRAYVINLNLLLEPKSNYELRFNFSIFNHYGYEKHSLGISRGMTLKSELTSKVVFELKSALNYHFLSFE